MKYGYLLILTTLLFYASNKTLAQENNVIDSLKQTVYQQTTDSARCYWYDVLAKEYASIQPDSGILYANRSLSLAKSLNIPGYEIDAYVTLGIIYRERGEFNKALDGLHKALKIISDKKLKRTYYKRVYSSLNLAYTEQGNYTAGIEYGFKTLHEMEIDNDTMAMALANNNLANTFFQLKQYDKAMKHYKVALRYALLIKHEYGQSLLNGNIGSVFYEMKKYDSAKIHFEKALELCKKVEDISGEAIAYGNLGSYYQIKGQNQTAIELFEKAEKIFEEMQMQPNQADMFFNLATSYLYLKDYKRSLEFAKRSLDMAKKIESLPHQQQAHEALKNAYEKSNNIPLAYHHYQEYIKARDSIYTEESKKEQFKAEVLYEYDKKKYADSLSQNLIAQIQKQELEKEKEKTETQRRFTIFSLLGLVLALTLAGFIFKGYKDKQKANLIISEQKKEVELQKDVIEAKNTEIIDSIEYAKRIQTSLLPTEVYIEKTLNRLNKK